MVSGGTSNSGAAVAAALLADLCGQ